MPRRVKTCLNACRSPPSTSTAHIVLCEMAWRCNACGAYFRGQSAQTMGQRVHARIRPLKSGALNFPFGLRRRAALVYKTKRNSIATRRSTCSGEKKKKRIIPLSPATSEGGQQLCRQVAAPTIFAARLAALHRRQKKDEGALLRGRVHARVRTTARCGKWNWPVRSKKHSDQQTDQETWPSSIASSKKAGAPKRCC